MDEPSTPNMIILSLLSAGAMIIVITRQAIRIRDLWKELSERRLEAEMMTSAAKSLEKALLKAKSEASHHLEHVKSLQDSEKRLKSELEASNSWANLAQADLNKLAELIQQLAEAEITPPKRGDQANKR